MENPSIMSHVSLGTNDFAKAKAFYTAVLETIGAGIVMEHSDAAAFGKKFPEFWVQAPIRRPALPQPQMACTSASGPIRSRKCTRFTTPP